MDNMAFKIKLVTSWIFVAVAHSASAIVSFMMPGVIEEIIAGTFYGMSINEGILLFAAFRYWLIPLTMALLSLMLKNAANRWANIIVGIIFTADHIITISDTLSMGQLTISLINITVIAVLAFIVWNAYKWSKQEV